ncbi:helix-turn-helix transcriptional regulator [Natrialbaceae archaeon A-gly3]
MRSSPALVFALTVLLVVSVGGVAAAATGLSQPSPQATTVDDQPPLQPGEPQQVIRINVSTDGDARWTLESHYRLETDDDVDRFETYAAAVTDGDRDAALEGGYDVSLFENALEQAESSTDREMALTDSGWDDHRIETTGDDHEIGVIAYSFTWSNFAAVGDNRLHLGDVFWADGQTWLPQLSDGQRLIIEPPENHGFEDPPVGTQNGALVWDGPYVFAEGELEVTFLEGASTIGSPGLSTVLVGIVILVLVILVGGGGYVLATKYPPARILGTDDKESTELEYDHSVGSSAEADRTHEDEPEDPYDVEPLTEEVDIDLLSDEERVHHLLRKNGGRVKQATIVEETGWSNAKVSQLLSKMDDNGEIEKLRIGRENLITLPEVDPTEID